MGIDSLLVRVNFGTRKKECLLIKTVTMVVYINSSMLTRIENYFNER